MSKKLIILISLITLDNVILLQLVLDKLNLISFTIYNLLGCVLGTILVTYYLIKSHKKRSSKNV